MQLIAVKDKEALKNAGIPFTQKTLYTFHSDGKYPEIFAKIGNNLFIIKEKWQKYVEAAVYESEIKAEKIKQMTGEV